MGWNSTLVLLNDHLSGIDSADFGPRVARAMRQMGGAPTKPIEIPGGILVESHHSDHCVPILVGGNHGWLIEKCFVRWSAADPERQLLNALAEKHGFELRVKRGKTIG